MRAAAPSSFRACCSTVTAIGGDVIDADVQLTADDIPIAFHDGTLERTTDGSGKVEQRTYAEIAGLDAGFGFVARV